MGQIGADQYQIAVSIIRQMGSYLPFTHPRVDVNQFYFRMIVPLQLLGVGPVFVKKGIFVGMTGVGRNRFKIGFIQRMGVFEFNFLSLYKVNNKYALPYCFWEFKPCKAFCVKKTTDKGFGSTRILEGSAGGFITNKTYSLCPIGGVQMIEVIRESI
jgi:hypothetical protein